MDASAAHQEGRAWYCPRCGAHNTADADACGACALGPDELDRHALLVVHACGVATPDWSTFCIGCGVRLIPLPPPRPRPRRPRHIMPAGDGSPEGLPMSRH